MDIGGEITMPAGRISIPLDVAADILCSLPAKSVLRFKAVSKAWCSLIDSPDFARFHLSASIDVPMLVIVTNQRSSDVDNPGVVLSADFYSLDDVEVDDDDGDGGASSRLRQVRPRSYPFKPRKAGTHALGSSCSGILAFGSYGGDLDFWNPTTNRCYSTSLLDFDPSGYPEFMGLQPRSTTVFYQDTNTCSSSCSHDHQYKLVQKVVQQPHGGGSICEFQSYNLEANGFTTFHTLPDDSAGGHLLCEHVSGCSTCCFVNGALHWLAPASNYDGDRGQYVIVALHLGTLERYKLPLPVGLKYRYRAILRILGGSLCATFSNYGNEGRYGIDVWVMKEYGGDWTKLLNFTTSHKDHNWVYPIAYSQSRDKVLLHFRDPYENLQWYHLKPEKLIPIKIPGAPKFFQPMLCLPTLVNYRS
ncbi:hypothetical protein Tsubulata_021031 [Turnera subulata]|uniref:F-box domain-containing protein n=1 Tax=Turnera subulata TaxID=218843 RepID=A0A9Q0FWJ3_9ROSI|nr:hypothetical protein Tsubulata_021031 [Turnera subulata]